MKCATKVLLAAMVVTCLWGLSNGPVWAGEQVTWKLNTYMTRTKGSPHGEALEQLVAGVKGASQGRFQINLYLGGELGIEATEALGAVNQGTLELNQGSSSYYYQQMDTMVITKLPFLASDQDTYGKIYRIILPYMAEELRSKYAVSILFAAPFNYNTIFTRQKVNFFDMKKTKLRVPGGLDTEAVSLLNAVGVPVPMGEVYQALDKGMLDGFESDITNLPVLKLWEVLKYGYSMPLLNSASVILMSTKAYEKLPADLQKILSAEAEKLYPTYYKSQAAYGQRARAESASHGIEFIPFTQAEFVKAQQLARPLWAKYEAKFGPIGKKAWAEVQKIVEGNK